MSQRDYILLDVFTDRVFGGNQLAVFPDGAGVDAAVMQAVARELNLSETVFVLPREGAAHATLRIFTPGMELPFAGHPTIGAAIALASDGGALAGATDILFAEQAGEVPVLIERREGQLSATLTSPKLPNRVHSDLSVESAAQVLGLTPADLAGIEAVAYSAGVPFHFIAVRSTDVLDRVALDLQAWRTHLVDSAAPHVVAMAQDNWTDGREVHVRMFAPLMGIAEDPATGAAAAALAGALVDRQQPDDGVARWTLHQGHAMGRPSTILLEADVRKGRPEAVRVGGTAVVVGRGTLRVE